MTVCVNMNAPANGRTFLLSLFVLIFLCACNESSQTQKQASISSPPEEEFRGFGSATNGARLTNIIAEFGDPISTRQFGNGTNVHDFMIDRSNKAPSGLAGVTLFEKDGVVSLVRPITGDRMPFTKEQLDNAKKIVPREVLIKIGDAALTVRPNAAAPSELNTDSGKPLVLRAFFDLNEEDVHRLQTFTSTNIGNRVGFYLGEEFAFEVPLVHEIRTNTLELHFEKPGVPLERLYKKRPTAGNEIPATK
jgi:hypothetical protein